MSGRYYGELHTHARSGEAKFLLGLAHQEGNGVAKNYALAIQWYKASVEPEQQQIDIALSRAQ